MYINIISSICQAHILVPSASLFVVQLASLRTHVYTHDYMRTRA